MDARPRTAECFQERRSNSIPDRPARVIPPRSVSVVLACLSMIPSDVRAGESFATASILRISTMEVGTNTGPCSNENGGCTATATTNGWMSWGSRSQFNGFARAVASGGGVSILLDANCKGQGGYFFGDLVKLRAHAQSYGRMTFDGPLGDTLVSPVLYIKATAAASGLGASNLTFIVTLGPFGGIESEIRRAVSQTLIEGSVPRAYNCHVYVAELSGPAFQLGPIDPPAWWDRYHTTTDSLLVLNPGIIEPAVEYDFGFSLGGELTTQGYASCISTGWPGNWQSRGWLDAGRTVTFATDGPVFDLPPGWTVNSTDFNIVDNCWMGSTTSPIVMSQPKAEPAVCHSDEVRFEVRATGEEPLSYQWLRDGEPVDGATGPSLIFSTPSTADVGIYECRVSNALGETLSYPVPLFLCVGDLECDTDTDLQDVSVLLARFGASSDVTPNDGDLDRDGDVDLTDAHDLLGALTGPRDSGSVAICGSTAE